MYWELRQLVSRKSVNGDQLTLWQLSLALNQLVGGSNPSWLTFTSQKPYKISPLRPVLKKGAYVFSVYVVRPNETLSGNWT